MRMSEPREAKTRRADGSRLRRGRLSMLHPFQQSKEAEDP
jgi:hypothetical protein